MTNYSFATYDVFTSRPYSGNPLAIVENAGDLSTDQMQTIAREFNLSETIFVMPPRDPANSARVRIFFPTAEIPFAGHPTVGCAIHLACSNRGDEDFETELVLEEEAGLVPVKVTRRSGQVQAEFKAPVLPRPHQGLVLTEALASATNVPANEIGFDAHAPALWSGGPSFLFVPVSSRAVLRNARPQEPAWSELMQAGAVDSAYLYCRDGDAFSARMFSPTAGIPEDPATGSASAILAAQLVTAGELDEGESVFALRQGEDMGRPSEVTLRINVKDGSLAAIYVSGSAVPITSGELLAPAA